MCQRTYNREFSFFLSSLSLFILFKTIYRNNEKFRALVKKQIAHEQKRDISLNVLLIKTTSDSSSQETLWKIHQRLPKFGK